MRVLRACLQSVYAVSLVLASGVGVARAQDTLVPRDETMLQGGDPWEGDAWGSAVACSASGDRVIIGSLRWGARVFVRTDDGWRLEHSSYAASRGDGLGFAVAMSADGRVAAIGAPSREGSGRVRVIVRTDAGWEIEDTLAGIDSAPGDRLGASLAFSTGGDRLFVGAPGDDVEDAANAGSVHVFVRSAEGWHDAEALVADVPRRGDGFGSAVAASSDGSMVLIGARGTDAADVLDAGSATVVTLDRDARPISRAVLAPSLAGSGTFGTSVALSGDGTRALVGAPRTTIQGLRSAGAAYSFARTDDGWSLELVVSGVAPDEVLGQSVALAADGSVALVGAPARTRAHVRTLVRTDLGGWSEGPGFSARDGDPSRYGWAVALASDGHRIVIGSPDAYVAGFHAGAAHALALMPPSDASRLASSFETPPFDATLRHELVLPHRSHEQEEQIRRAGLGLIVAGGPVLVGGAVAMLGAALSNERCVTGFFFRSCSYRTDEGLLALGATLFGLGAVAMITGGAVYSQRQQGPRSPRVAMAPSLDGFRASVALDF